MTERLRALLKQYGIGEGSRNMDPAERSRRAASVGQRLAAMPPDQRRVVFQQRAEAVGEPQARQEFSLLAQHVQAANRAGHDSAYQEVLRRSGAW